MAGDLTIAVRAVHRLRFDDGAPVRAASGITPFEDGWLVVSDDATHAALWEGQRITRLRILPAVRGHDLFDEVTGTKALKPDLEAACRVPDAGGVSALLLGSGSLPARMRAVLVEEGTRHCRSAELGPLYQRIAATLDLPTDRLNLEGACLVAGALRCFQRGNVHLDVPSASVDVELDALLAALRGDAPADAVAVSAPRVYDLGSTGGDALAVTDALTLPDGRVLLAAAAEDTPNAVDDGTVSDAALLLLSGDRVVARGSLPGGPQGPDKVEGLALAGGDRGQVRVVAVVDADDPSAASQALELTVRLP